MIRHPFAVAVTALLLAVTGPAQAPAPAAIDLARALVAAQATATDDPDAAAIALLQAAAAHGDSPAAAILCISAIGLGERLQRPAAVLAVAAGIPTAGLHGVFAQRLQEFCWQLAGAVGTAGSGRDLPPPPARGPDPWQSFAGSFLAVGPFGDAGDHYAGVAFAPEFAFPAAGTELPGRLGPVQPRALRRHAGERRVELAAPGAERPGCYYGLHRVTAAADTHGFAELEGDGAMQLFVNGAEVARIEPYREPGPALRRIAIGLRAGDNQVLVKTCSNEQCSIALRYIDARGRPLAGLREVAAEAPLQAAPAPLSSDGATFVDGLAVLEHAAAAATGEDQAVLRLAVLLQAQRANVVDTALSTAAVLLPAPPQAPTALLVLADQLRQLAAWPEEVRQQRAREFEDAALAALPADHHRAMLARAHQLQDQDQGEAALRLLRQAIARGTAGPATFAATYELLQVLHFDDEVPVLLEQWIAVCPGDVRPRQHRADWQKQKGDPAAALAGLCAALRARPDQTDLAESAFQLALDVGDFPTAERCLPLLDPQAFATEPPPLRALLPQSTLARRRGDATRQRELLAAVVAHPDADAETLKRAGERWLQLGDTPAAVAAFQRSLQLDPDQHALLDSLASLQGQPRRDADLVAFRRDGLAAAQAFVKTAREDAASTTLVLDQMLMEVYADGSSLEEVHQVRRINDLQGVESMKQPPELAQADEVLLLRTITQGQTFVPARTEGGFTMVRLEPGAFLEWRYRRHRPAAKARPWRSPEYLFGSMPEATLLGECILVLPKSPRGELRLRGVAKADEERTLADGRHLLVFRRTDLPRQPEERSSPPANELLPVLQFGGDAELGAYARQVRASLLRQTRPVPAVRQQAAQLQQQHADRQELLQAIHDWTQREIADGPDHGLTAALLRKKGERFLVEGALLRAAGFQVDFAVAQPVRSELAEDPAPLFADDERWPLPMLRVHGPQGDRWLGADAPRHTPLGLLPGARQGAQALVATDDGVRIERLGTDGPDTARVLLVHGDVAVAADGEVQLRGQVEFPDPAGYGLAEQVRTLKADVRKVAARQFAQRFFPGWRTVAAAFERIDPPGQAPALQFTFARSLLQRDGERCLLPLPLPPGTYLAAFGDRTSRELPLRLTTELRAEWVFSFDPGPDFMLAQLPPDVLIQRGPLSFALTFRRDGAGVRIERRALVRAATIEPAAFGEWLQALQAADVAETCNLVLMPRARAK